MRKILVVIDMQNDFIDGALGTEEAQQIVAPAAAKMASYPRKDIFATRDTHGADYLQTQEGRRLPVMHCISGTPGWMIRDEIAAYLDPDQIIDKPTFGSVELAARLRTISKQEEIELELIGLCTDICVVSNALLLKACMPEVPIRVDASCCAGVTVASHEAALQTMRSCQIEVCGV